MTRRLVIQGGSDSAPFRVSSAAAGDAGSASKFNLIFDGNQRPLRYLIHGYLPCPGMAYENSAAAVYTRTDNPVYSAPEGQYPLFTVMEWRSVSPNPARGITVRKYNSPTSGIGGVLSGGYFYGLNFTRQAMIPVFGGSSYLGPMPLAYVCYLIFKNYG